LKCLTLLRKGQPRLGQSPARKPGLTIACRRLEIASAPASLRLFPAPDAWRWAPRGESRWQTSAGLGGRVPPPVAGTSTVSLAGGQERVRPPRTGPRRAGGGCSTALDMPTPWPVRAVRWQDTPVPRVLCPGRAERVAPKLEHGARAPPGLRGVIGGAGDARRRSERGRVAGAASGPGPTG